jgi:conjugal transfer pilus assembly protein TraW
MPRSCARARLRSRTLAGLLMVMVAHIHAQAPLALQGTRPADRAGPVYPIAEPDMLEEIEAKLRGMERSGALAAKIDEAVKRSTHSAQYPKPVAGLSATKTARTYYFDPSVASNADIKDAEGKTVVAAGTTVNPLDYVSLTEWLLFFDGNDPRQVRLAEAIGKRFDWAVKPILVGGGPLDLMRKWKRRVFFDQGGSLTGRLGIANVPAMVTQEGKRLRIDELTP